VLRQERICRLSRAILRLPLYLQRVARLRYLEELTGPDIAAAIGVQPHTVPGYFALIRQHLRHELADVYDLPMPDAATRYQRIDPRYQHEAR
jgi:DNA-directed RNA polymerase specialized sigma24 family protein